MLILVRSPNRGLLVNMIRQIIINLFEFHLGNCYDNNEPLMFCSYNALFCLHSVLEQLFCLVDLIDKFAAFCSLKIEYLLNFEL